MTIENFQQIIWDHYLKQGRDLPWRRPEVDEQFNSYKILVSEVMLQQTQVSRVIPKYQSFLEQFPTIEELALAPLSAVLRAWSGLGYNRRAKYLHEAAKQLATIPQVWSLEDLASQKGIGLNTAAAIIVYSHNQPVVFIETNIRAIFIYHFFQDQSNIADREILELVKRTLPNEDVRQWYWALMDYGAHLKATTGNYATKSRHYTKQTPFEGSLRQLRGQVVRLLSTTAYSNQEITQAINDDRLPVVLAALQTEGLIRRRGGIFRLVE